MADNIELYETLKAWSDIVIERWELRISQLKIIDTRELIRSFTYHVTNDANGNPEKILFAFAYYGKFVDMGVGKGIPASAAPTGNRKPKPWHSKVFFGQVQQLSRILAEKYGIKAEQMIIERLTL
ncbi:MAG: hypothetical protein LBG19_10600 [Prevotellaceae bacterium]|jgi:hypothetical protein|nr:hypothetical protein [Prevotellaceae bacterium]